jgi:hypothetical protein
MLWQDLNSWIQKRFWCVDHVIQPKPPDKKCHNIRDSLQSCKCNGKPALCKRMKSTDIHFLQLCDVYFTQMQTQTLEIELQITGSQCACASNLKSLHCRKALYRIQHSQQPCTLFNHRNALILKKTTEPTCYKTLAWLTPRPVRRKK